MTYHIDTKCLYGNKDQSYTDATGSLTVPIYQAATFAHPGVGQSTGYDYSRAGNPTREQLEKIVASLEGGYGCAAFTSGMAALTALMEIFKPGDHIIASSDLYGGSVRLFDNVNQKNGLKIDYINTSDLTAVKNALKPETKAFYIETPSNPMMNVTDLAEISKLAKQHQCLVIVDNTFLSPYLQRPIEHGADVVLHSGTKYLGGHNDTLAGFLILKDRELNEKIQYLIKTTGACLSPFDSWLILRGLKTLPIRMDKQQENALFVCKWLKQQSKVKEVFYIGLEEHPGHQVHLKQASGFGGMISFRVDSRETAVRFLERVRMIHYAESLGGVETLITYPMLQTHGDLSEETRNALGITDTLLRLSVGIEHINDIIDDLTAALED